MSSRSCARALTRLLEREDGLPLGFFLAPQLEQSFTNVCISAVGTGRERCAELEGGLGLLARKPASQLTVHRLVVIEIGNQPKRKVEIRGRRRISIATQRPR